MRSFCYCFTLVGIMLSIPSGTQAQVENPFRFSGGFGLFYDGYRFSQENFPNFRPRHPENLGRFTADATLSAGRHFTMPFAISITTQQNSYLLPTLPEERFLDYVRNPRNNVSFNPTYKWASAYLGTQTPTYSSLSTGDIAMFGLGLELTPGNFLFTINQGKSQLGIEYDPFNNVEGAYEQKILTSRIGYGKMDGTHFILNYAKSKDDVNSVNSQPVGIRPKEGLTFSPLLQIRFSPTLVLKTETAASVFTNDLLAPELEIENDILDFVESFITINASSNADFANVTSLDWKKEKFSLGGEVRYVGPGFQSAGYRAMERDIIDYLLKSNLNLLQNRVFVNGSFGIRTNNLQNTTLNKTRRTILNTSVFAQVTEKLSVNTNYANFGFRNNVVFDTLRIEMINHSFSVTPTYRFETEKHNHTISTSVNYNVFDDYNVFSGGFQKTVSTSFNGNYTIGFEAIPLNLGVMGMYLQNRTPTTDIDMVNLALNGRYRMFDNKLTPAVLISYSTIKRDAFSADHRVRVNLRTDYKISKLMSFRASYNFSNYNYGTSRPDASTIENRIQLALQMRF